MKWSKKVEDDIQCFTIREIAATIKALSPDEIRDKNKNENKNKNINIYDKIFNTIMIIYGARYPKEKKNELENELKTELEKVFKEDKNFKFSTDFKSIIPNNFPKFYENKIIINTISSILFSFENQRHVIITGKEGNGKTQLAKWISEYWNNKNNENEEDDIYFCVCTENFTCRDIIGWQYITNLEDKEFGEELIE